MFLYQIKVDNIIKLQGLPMKKTNTSPAEKIITKNNIIDFPTRHNQENLEEMLIGIKIMEIIPVNSNKIQSLLKRL